MAYLAPLENLCRVVIGGGCPSRRDERQVEQIHDAAAALRSVCSAELARRAEQLRQQVRMGQAEPNTLTVPVFALVREAARRALAIELFDTQLRAGLALARGAIAEMATGEGKTLACVAPAFLHSLSGRSVHVATPNAYLAGRDAQQVRPIFELLGTSVGLVPEQAASEAKQAAYACDVVYATGYELGFDYLRDQLRLIQTPKPRLGESRRRGLHGDQEHAAPGLQRGHAWAIIDEIDAVLIDEACLPLVLSDRASAAAPAAAHQAAARLCARLRAGIDFHLDAECARITLTAQGTERAYEAYAAAGDLELLRPWEVYVTQALAARHLHHRDVHYVVRDGKVLLVDEFTGRIFPDRSWRDGLQQAVETNEGLPLTAEHQTAARISRQRYFKLYAGICGMTGTTGGAEREFWNLYRLPIASVPLRKPCRRNVLPTRFFATAAAKWRAIVAEIAELHARGRPVLVGSRTIANSELLARHLQTAGLPFLLLNGKQDQAEAEIVARAGQLGTVTIATNMAGRGTDIRLGFGVAELGGLHVIGVEPHEARRIDRQLLGRAARQGDPGSGRFFVSAEDHLLERFGPRLGRRMANGPQQSGEITADLAADLEAVQRKAEAAAYLARRRLLAFDRWLDETLATLAKDC